MGRKRHGGHKFRRIAFIDVNVRSGMMATSATRRERNSRARWEGQGRAGNGTQNGSQGSRIKVASQSRHERDQGQSSYRKGSNINVIFVEFDTSAKGVPGVVIGNEQRRGVRVVV